jgi:hypothetical protein
MNQNIINQAIILYPVIALIALTFFIGFLMLRSRFAAVKNKQVSIKYFRLNHGGIPENMQCLSDNYDNLLSMPVLFYFSMLVIYVFHVADTGYLVLGWVYVVLRFAHSYIHVVYNNVIHRMYAFVLSAMVLISIWLRLFVYLIDNEVV